ncbi:unnamed protein product [Vitrella brassicaformis CCMP3155]|uniref:IPT/TIG domain-containing protein n=1 Tax=Vitrella brassicaformis (strain CCMP3155) TaxID=1169540 RepID=A0A0G4E9D6_VITBC|nr:unnamed protein product [Vitrella brassicaformis CCMP3155]|eukprot:CEL91853.1 unnamed protein product [Vitrella brassicaformis CCMP3155]
MMRSHRQLLTVVLFFIAFSLPLAHGQPDTSQTWTLRPRLSLDIIVNGQNLDAASRIRIVNNTSPCGSATETVTLSDYVTVEPRAANTASLSEMTFTAELNNPVIAKVCWSEGSPSGNADYSLDIGVLSVDGPTKQDMYLPYVPEGDDTGTLTITGERLAASGRMKLIDQGDGCAGSFSPSSVLSYNDQGERSVDRTESSFKFVRPLEVGTYKMCYYYGSDDSNPDELGLLHVHYATVENVGPLEGIVGGQMAVSALCAEDTVYLVASAEMYAVDMDTGSASRIAGGGTSQPLPFNDSLSNSDLFVPGLDASLVSSFGAALSVDEDTLYISTEGCIVGLSLINNMTATHNVSGSCGDSGMQDGDIDTVRYQSPAGLAMHPLTNTLYVADTSAHRIRTLNLSGSDHAVATLVGTGTSGISEGALSSGPLTLSSPTHLALEAKTEMLFFTQGDPVTVLSVVVLPRPVPSYREGTVRTVVSGSTSPAAPWGAIGGLAVWRVDENNYHVYVGDETNGDLYRIKFTVDWADWADSPSDIVTIETILDSTSGQTTTWGSLQLPTKSIRGVSMSDGGNKLFFVDHHSDGPHTYIRTVTLRKQGAELQVLQKQSLVSPGSVTVHGYHMSTDDEYYIVFGRKARCGMGSMTSSQGTSPSGPMKTQSTFWGITVAGGGAYLLCWCTKAISSSSCSSIEDYYVGGIFYGAGPILSQRVYFDLNVADQLVLRGTEMDQYMRVLLIEAADTCDPTMQHSDYVTIIPAAPTYNFTTLVFEPVMISHVPGEYRICFLMDSLTVEVGRIGVAGPITMQRYPSLNRIYGQYDIHLLGVNLTASQQYFLTPSTMACSGGLVQVAGADSDAYTLDPTSPSLVGSVSLLGDGSYVSDSRTDLITLCTITNQVSPPALPPSLAADKAAISGCAAKEGAVSDWSAIEADVTNAETNKVAVLSTGYIREAGLHTICFLPSADSSLSEATTVGTVNVQGPIIPQQFAGIIFAPFSVEMRGYHLSSASAIFLLGTTSSPRETGDNTTSSVMEFSFECSKSFDWRVRLDTPNVTLNATASRHENSTCVVGQECEEESLVLEVAQITIPGVYGVCWCAEDCEPDSWNGDRNETPSPAPAPFLEHEQEFRRLHSQDGRRLSSVLSVVTGYQQLVPVGHVTIPGPFSEQQFEVFAQLRNYIEIRGVGFQFFNTWKLVVPPYDLYPLVEVTPPQVPVIPWTMLPFAGDDVCETGTTADTNDIYLDESIEINDEGQTARTLVYPGGGIGGGAAYYLCWRYSDSPVLGEKGPVDPKWLNVGIVHVFGAFANQPSEFSVLAFVPGSISIVGHGLNPAKNRIRLVDVVSDCGRGEFPSKATVPAQPTQANLTLSSPQVLTFDGIMAFRPARYFVCLAPEAEDRDYEKTEYDPFQAQIGVMQVLGDPSCGDRRLLSVRRDLVERFNLPPTYIEECDDGNTQVHCMA